MKIMLREIFVFAAILVASCRGDENTDTGRVTGGWNASPGLLPFMAAVYNAEEFLCGGAIVHEKWVLTSATCVSGLVNPPVPDTKVKVGGVLQSLAVIETGSLVIGVTSIVFHWGFNTTIPPHDIHSYNLALLELTSPILPGSLMSRIVRATANVAAGTRLYLAGWGGQSNSLPVDHLQYSDQVTVKDLLDCGRSVGQMLNENFVCTMSYPMHTACHYDEGGPLFSVDSLVGFQLLGIVSYTPCTTLNSPTVYSDITARAIQTWINMNVPFP